MSSMAAESSGLLAQVRANQALLAGCRDHNFAPITPGLFGTRYVCRNCNGETDGVSVKWYLVGREHERAAHALPVVNP
jgi:hypothetical protein